MLPGIHFFTASALSYSLSKNYFSSFLIGIAVHHILDYLPHLDVNLIKKRYQKRSDLDLKFFLFTLPEFIIFTILTFYFIGDLSLDKQKIIFIGGISGILPDLLNFFDLFLNGKLSKLALFRKYKDFHKDFHFEYKGKKLLPILVEIFVFLFALVIFLGKG